ncbi:MAG: divergent polysaccharide deacetylase family protein [Candidatus Zixiibacteriota bacterium]
MVDYDPNYRKVKPYKDRRLFYKIASVILGVLLIVGTVFLLIRDSSTSSNTNFEIDGLAKSDISSFDDNDASSSPNLEERLDSCIADCRFLLGVPENQIRIRNTQDESGLPGIMQKRIFMNVPDVFPMAHVNQIVHFAFRRRNYEVIDGLEIIAGRKILVKAGENGFVTHIITIRRRQDIKPEIGYVSLIIGGFGKYPVKSISDLLDIKDPFTAAIMPEEEYSYEIYHALKEKNTEKFISISLKTNHKRNNSSINENDIKRTMERAFRDFPDAVGAVNLIHKNVKRKSNIFAITIEDSYVDSIFYINDLVGKYPKNEKIIRNEGFLFAPVDYIIDITKEENGAGSSELFDFALMSRLSETGVIIGIYIDEANIRILDKNIRRLKRLGIRLLPASEMIRRKENWQNQQKSTAS